MNQRKCENGFTIVEMLIVVSILGALAATVLSVVSVEAQKKRAQDTVLRSKLEQYTQTVESYGAGEGFFPTAASGIPVGPSLGELMGSWDSASGFTYVVNAERTDFAIYVPISNGSYYKYVYSWGEIRNCTSPSIAVLSACLE